jgi:ferritin-like metal-binding protein YciE
VPDEITRLMTEQLRDPYSAEKHALGAIPRMMKHASAQALRDALQTHVKQTER